jgi:hypothetical protein
MINWPAIAIVALWLFTFIIQYRFYDSIEDDDLSDQENNEESPLE